MGNQQVPTGVLKMCNVRGTDVSSKKRVKDTVGRYYCSTCYQAAAEVQKTTVPIAAPVVPPQTVVAPSIAQNLQSAAPPLLSANFPFLRVAAILSFVWAGLAVLVSFIQNGHGAGGWALWNLCIAGFYVFIGLRLLQNHPKARETAIWTNGLNGAWSIFQMLTMESGPILLLVVEAAIVAVLIAERKAAVAGASAIGTGDEDQPVEPAPKPSPTPASRAAMGSRRAKSPSAPVEQPVATESPESETAPPPRFSPAKLLVAIPVIGVALLGAFGARMDLPGVWNSLTNGGSRTGSGSSSHERRLSEPALPPTIRVTGNVASLAVFSDWRVDGLKVVGTMRFSGSTLFRAQYTIKDGETIVGQNNLDMATSDGAPRGAPVEVSMFIGTRSTDDMVIEIEMMGAP